MELKAVLGIAGKLWPVRQQGAHVLEFSEEAIVLWFEEPAGKINEIGRAVLNAPDFSRQIDALRVETLIRDPARHPVSLWLPASQVLERDYFLGSASPGPARAEAMRRLQSETGCAAEELSIVMAIEPDDKSSRIFATHVQTVREAKEYAARWGFVPGRVSTERADKRLTNASADFRLPVARLYSTGLKAAQAAAVSAVIMGIGFAGLKVYEVAQPVLTAIVIQDVPGHMPLPVVEPAMQVNVARASAPVARLASLQSMPFQRFAVTGSVGSASRIAEDQKPAPASIVPSELSQPSFEVSMRIGGEGRTPARSRPGRLGELGVVTSRADVLTVRLAIDRIRQQAKALAAVPLDVGRPQFKRVVASGAVVPSAQHPLLEGEVPAAIPVVLDDGGPASGNNSSLFRAATRAISGSGEASEHSLRTTPEGAEEGKISAINPAKAILPTPRPLPDQPLTVSVAGPADEREPTSPVRAPDAGPTEINSQERHPDEQYAALTSPTPRRRPAGLRAADPVLPKKNSVPKVQRSPARVGNAANERGLELGQTNLVGVIEATTGRRALVRLPDGDFRKVAQGDDVNGWRVSSIERAAMRLTRKGQNRTLLLVSR